MNISTIAEMIRQDPTITESNDSIQAFVDRMNTKDQRVFVRTETIRNQIYETKSRAELEGGECTAEQVQKAIDLLAQEGVVEKLVIIYQEQLSKIRSNEITTEAQLKTELSKLGGK